MKTAITKRLSAAILALTGLCSVYASAQPQFSKEAAFKRLYGNYDPGTATATWNDFVFPKAKDWSESNRFVCETAPEPLRVHLLIDMQTVEDGAIKHYFVTWAAPQSWTKGSGRQCKVAIGATVFVWRNNDWEIESSSRYLASAGTYGLPPRSVKDVRVGRARHGVLLETSDLTQGYYWTDIRLIAPVATDFREVWAANISDDNSGTCSNDEKERKEVSLQKCYASSASYSFVETGSSEYFDIRLVSKGTSMDSNDRIIPENWTKLYRFREGSYREVNKVAGGRAKIRQ